MFEVLVAFYSVNISEKQTQTLKTDTAPYRREQYYQRSWDVTACFTQDNKLCWFSTADGNHENEMGVLQANGTTMFVVIERIAAKFLLVLKLVDDRWVQFIKQCVG